MPTARRLALAVALLLVTLVTAPAAYAADIPRLEGPVTDTTGVLDGSIDEIEAALDDLLDDHGVQLFVAFVDTTDELTATGFVDETARVNSLGANDALLVVALDDRTDAIWLADGLGEITDAEVDRIIADVLEPGLADGAFGAAVVATARALGDAAAPFTPTALPTAAPTTPPGDGGTTGGGGIGLGTILALIALVVGGVLVVRWLIVRQSVARESGERDRRLVTLAREANAKLIEMDERIRNADQEAGFVEAEYGDAEAAPFRSAIAEARQEMQAAFSVRQKLDDGEPEDPPTREGMLGEIVARTGKAAAALDRQAARIEELRDLEKHAPAIIAALPAQVAAQESRLPAVEATLAGLRGYAESAWGSVRGNVEEARKGLTGARSAIERGNAALARSEGQQAARELRMAQEGVAGAAAMLDAVDKLAASIREADARVAEELRAADADLAAARMAFGGARTVAVPTADHDAAFAAAEEALRAARAAAAARPLDPIAAHKLATEAHRRADDVLAAVRADAEQHARLVAAVDASLTTARADVDRAADFIATRRNGVGRQARTRLAEADRLLQGATALRASDPKAAMEQARRAERMAEEAYSLAGNDFDQFDRGGPGAGAGRSGGSDIAGAILGGIIGSILSGGGRRSGGWGGSPWGSQGPFGGGGGWGGGGRSRGGGFGGFGGGGGGGRSRGGRW
jgi:uncharacterized membrane protein YgcG